MPTPRSATSFPAPLDVSKKIGSRTAVIFKTAVAACFGAAVLGLMPAPTIAVESLLDNECSRIFRSAGWPSSFRWGRDASPPGFDAKQATSACIRAVERSPQEPFFRLFLSDAYWFAGEREAAVRVRARIATRFGVTVVEVPGLSDLAQNADALALLKTLAETDGDAQVALAHLYKRGHDVPKDTDLASSLFRRAAEQGNPEGQFQVGQALWWAAYNRDDAVADAWRVEAEPWLRKAVAQYHLGAQELIDDGYDKVRANQKQDNETLIRARRGDVLYQARLGLEYVSDFRGPPSELDAYAWLTIALERGGDEVEYVRNRWSVLAERMNQAQMAEARAHTAAVRLSLCLD